MKTRCPHSPSSSPLPLALVCQPRQARLPYWISAARVAVLSWRPGGKVTIMGGGTRDSIKVAASDVVLP